MQLPFLNRTREVDRLRRALDRGHDSLLCLYGRRRLGKSRLIRELRGDRSFVYYVGDDREAPVQRASLAREIDAAIPGFAAVVYPGWQELLDRWWREAPPRATLVLDELPALVQSSPELPSVLQKRVDDKSALRRKLILCGSSQRVMLGLLMDGSSPLFGRAEEILKIEPLGLGSLKEAFQLRGAEEVVRRWAVWGGVPRYWELALDYEDHAAAVRELVLDPLGVLYQEPERLLRDEVDQTTRAASILTLVGQGCHRVSEIGARLGQPTTSLSRPLARLSELGLILRQVPFGTAERDAKRSLYGIGDPFLRYWYRFIEPNRSRLGAGQVVSVEADIKAAFPQHLGSIWEDLARSSVGRLKIEGHHFGPASRWWGRGTNGETIELDVVPPDTKSSDRVLVGEAKLSVNVREVPRLLAELARKVTVCPALQGKKPVLRIWALAALRGATPPGVITGTEVVEAG